MGKANRFERTLTDSVIEKLREKALYTNRLRGDIEKRDVFLAVRKDTITFYYGGGNLFEFEADGVFKTHSKYTSVFRKDSSEDYIWESDLANVQPIRTFEEGYDRIKENCARHADMERRLISVLCRKFSYVNKDSDIVILDIEVGLPKQGGKNSGVEEDQVNKVDFIDFVLYHKIEKKLRFFEVKRFANKELRAKNSEPKVVGQIQGYERQIRERKKEILDAYEKYIAGVNKLFSFKLPKPECLDDHVPLLICEYDSSQERDVKSHCTELNDYKIKSYCIGGMERCKIMNLWKRTT